MFAIDNIMWLSSSEPYIREAILEEQFMNVILSRLPNESDINIINDTL